MENGAFVEFSVEKDTCTAAVKVRSDHVLWEGQLWVVLLDLCDVARRSPHRDPNPNPNRDLRVPTGRGAVMSDSLFFVADVDRACRGAAARRLVRGENSRRPHVLQERRDENHVVGPSGTPAPYLLCIFRIR